MKPRVLKFYYSEEINYNDIKNDPYFLWVKQIGKIHRLSEVIVFEAKKGIFVRWEKLKRVNFY